MPNEEPRSQLARGYGAGYGIVAAGFQLALSILFFLWMGSLADRKLGTRPFGLLIGLGIGMAAGGYAFYLKVQAASKPSPRQPDGDKRR